MPRIYVDLTGQKFGKLLVIERFINPLSPTKTYFRCICDCGREKIARSYKLQGGLTKSCGCLKPCGCPRKNSAIEKLNMPRKLADLTGQRFGKLVVIEKVINPAQPTKTHFSCICDCGRERIVPSYMLKNGRIKTCGCGNANRAKSIEKLKEFNKANPKARYEKPRKSKINRVIEKAVERPRMKILNVKDYHTGELYQIVNTHIMNMEERQLDKKHYYTSIYIFPSIPSEKYEYRVKEKISEIKNQLMTMRLAA